MMTTSIVLLLRATDPDNSLLLAGSNVGSEVLKQMRITIRSFLKDVFFSALHSL